MSEHDISFSGGQVKFLMSRFQIADPNEAIEFLIEMMFLEGVKVNSTTIKKYVLRMMEKELEDEDSE